MALDSYFFGNYYVYQCKVNGYVRYIGKGFGDRYKHCVSGKSSCRRLNRDLYAGKRLDVEIVEDGLSEHMALVREQELINQYSGQLYNIRGHVDFLDVDGSIVNSDSPQEELYSLLQCAVERESALKQEVLSLKAKQTNKLWYNILKCKKKDDLLRSIYILMLENAKLQQKIYKLESEKGVVNE